MRIYVVRHGHAGSRSRWDKPDELRPLSERGWAQANVLVDLFGTAPISRVLSSPYVRCIQTVRPLADAHGLEVESHLALAEGGGVEPTMELVERLIKDHRDGATDAVLCSHGDVIPELIAELLGRGMETNGARGSQKGSTWVLETKGKKIVRGRYVPPTVSDT